MSCHLRIEVCRKNVQWTAENGLGLLTFPAFNEEINQKLKWTLAYKFKEGKKRKKEDDIWPAHQEYV